MHNITLLVATCYAYKDVFYKFKDLFNKNWKSCPCALYVVADAQIANVAPFIPIVDSGNWIARLKVALEKINTDFVLLLLDDYFIGRNAKFEELENVINCLNFESGNCVRLLNIPQINGKQTDYNDIFKIYSNYPYVLNLQPTIWRKSVLKEIIDKNDGSAWDFEVNVLENYSKKCNFDAQRFYFYKANLLDIKNAVIKGAWVPDIDIYLDKEGVSVVTRERKKMTRFSWIYYNIKSQFAAICPLALRKPIKLILKKFGFKFYSDI